MSETEREAYKKQLKDYYDRQAAVYHTAYTGEQGRYPTARHRMEICLTLVDQIEPRPQTILDAGCGDARMVVELNKRGYQCTGFDVSDGLLDLGRKHLKDAGLPETLISTGDIYKIPAADKSVDVVMSLGVMENLDDHEAIFKEFHRILRPGGRILVSLDNHLFSLMTFNQHTVGFFKSLFEDIDIPQEARNNVLRKIAGWMNIDDVQQIDRIIEDRQIDRKAVKLPVYHRLNVDDEFRRNGFRPDRLRFCHVHPLPPRFEKEYPELFGAFAEKLETPEYKWQNTLLCNCMIVQAVVDE
ncbi:MAG: class I SAM-dependent methyltransferase [Ramlibacter sp.]